MTLSPSLFLLLLLLLLVWKTESHSQYDSLREIDDAIKSVEKIVSQDSASLSGAISLAILYYIRDDQFMQGGNWQALYFTTKALERLNETTDSFINKKNLHYALFMHQQKLLMILGRYVESASELEAFRRSLLKLPTSLPHRRRLSMISLSIGEALQAAGNVSAATVAFQRAIEEFSCNHQAYYKLAQSLSMLRNEENPSKEDFAIYLREKTEEALSKLMLETRKNTVIFEDQLTLDVECETGDSEVNNMDELFKHSSISNNISSVSISLNLNVIDKHHHLRLVLSTFHWTLYLLAEMRKDYDLAWFHMSQMRFLERFRLLQSTVYNKTTSVNKVSFIRQHITADYWPKKKSQWVGLADEKLPVFIVGFFRSGSTLLESLLDMHPEVWGMGEHSILTYYIIQMQSELSELTSITDPPHYMRRMSSVLQKYGKEIVAAMRERLYWHYSGLTQMKDSNVTSNYTLSLPSDALPSANSITRIVDKMLMNYLNIPFIHLMFPNAIILHMVRDPLDTLLSCMKNRFGDYSAYTLEFRTLVAEYTAYLEIVGHFRKVLPVIPTRNGVRKAMIDVRYEELVSNPEKVMRRVFSFLEVSKASEQEIVSSFHLQDRLVRTASFLQVKQPIYLKSIGNWRKYAPQFQQTLIPELTKSLRRLLSQGLLPYTIDGPGNPRINWELNDQFSYSEMIEKFANQ